MEIVFFLNDLKSGGVQKRTLRLITGLVEFDKESQFNLTLIVSQNNGDYFELIHPSVEVIVLDRQKRSNVIINLKNALGRIEPDLVVTCMGQEFLKALLARLISSIEAELFIIQAVPAKLPGVSFYKNFIRSIGIRTFYGFASKIICVSTDVKNSLVSLQKSFEDKIEVIYNPVVKKNITSLSNQEVKHTFFEENAKVLISVGRLHIQKDYPTLIEAFRIAQNSSSISLKLIIVGEGEERVSLERLIEKYQLYNDVSLAGYQDNPFAYMKRADLFVMSSLWEGLPSVLIEALAVGTPIVSTDCKAGPREILKNGKYGTLVPVADPNALADGIIEELNIERDPKKLVARSRIFSVENSVSKYQELFNKYR